MWYDHATYTNTPYLYALVGEPIKLKCQVNFNLILSDLTLYAPKCSLTECITRVWSFETLPMLNWCDQQLYSLRLKHSILHADYWHCEHRAIALNAFPHFSAKFIVQINSHWMHSHLCHSITYKMVCALALKWSIKFEMK